MPKRRASWPMRSSPDARKSSDRANHEAPASRSRRHHRPLLLLGCVVMTGTSKTDFAATRQADMVFIGLPAPLNWLVAGMQGTTFPGPSTLSLTAAHVAVPLLKPIKAQHPICDVAVIADNNLGKIVHQLAYARAGRNVTLFGYSAINSLPKSSRGKIDGFVKRNGCYCRIITGAGRCRHVRRAGDRQPDRGGGGDHHQRHPGEGAVVFIAVQDFTNLLDRMRIPYKTY